MSAALRPDGGERGPPEEDTKPKTRSPVMHPDWPAEKRKPPARAPWPVPLPETREEVKALMATLTQEQLDRMPHLWWRPNECKRHLARRAVANARRRGTLVPPTTCPKCGWADVPRGRMHAHHHDYDRPLDIEWLCESCHAGLHRPKRGGGP